MNQKKTMCLALLFIIGNGRTHSICIVISTLYILSRNSTFITRNFNFIAQNIDSKFLVNEVEISILYRIFDFLGYKNRNFEL